MPARPLFPGRSFFNSQSIVSYVSVPSSIDRSVLSTFSDRAVEHELAFGLVAAADVLEDQEVAVAREFAHPALIHAPGIPSVGGALDQERERFLRF